jgi:hypothetical protein
MTMGSKPITIVVAFFVTSACSTTPVDRRENVKGQLSEVKIDMVEARLQIDRALVSLNALLTAPPESLREVYERYEADVSALRENVDNVDKGARQLQQQRDEWLAQWRASQHRVQSDELRAVSEDRHSQVASRFQTIDSSFEAAWDAYRPLVENLDDLRIVVGSDLTPTGIAAVANTGVVRDAFNFGARVDENLEAAIVEFDELTSVLDPKPDH